MYCDLWWQYIKVRKLFKGGNYSRAETIHGNTVIERLGSKVDQIFVQKLGDYFLEFFQKLCRFYKGTIHVLPNQDLGFSDPTPFCDYFQ